MLDKVNLKVKIDKAAYKEKRDALALKLGVYQRRIKELGIPVLIVFEGWDAAGKGTLINELMVPLDPRSFEVYSGKRRENDDEINRPLFWKYWTKTPKKGQMVTLDGAYYSELIHDDARSTLEFQMMIGEANEFEKVLTDSGTIIVKFFVHISKKEQKRRFQKLEKDPATRWRVTEMDWKENREYAAIEKKVTTSGVFGKPFLSGGILAFMTAPGTAE